MLTARFGPNISASRLSTFEGKTAGFGSESMQHRRRSRLIGRLCAERTLAREILAMQRFRLEMPSGFKASCIGL